MTATKLHTTHGIDLFERASGPACVWGYRGSVWVGWAWQAENGEWRARRFDEPHDYRMASRHAGVAYVVSGCPDCVCEPVLCRTDDSGDSCLDCGYCLNGCSADECPMEAA